MKNRVLVTTVSLLLSSTLSFAQEGRTVGKNHAGGPYQRGVKNPSYNRCDALAPTIMAGGSAFEDYIPIFGDAYYGAFLKAGHSYEVEVWNPFGEDDSYLNFRPQLSLLNGNCDPKDYIDVATIDPALNLGFSDRISWTQNSDGYRFVHLQNFDPNNAYLYYMRIVDTTLFNPRWSTINGFGTSWGLNNITNADISGTFTVYDTSGSVLKTQSVIVPAGRTKFYSSSADLSLPNNASGSAMFAFIGPSGAIQADAYMVNSGGTVVVPTKFEPRNSQW